MTLVAGRVGGSGVYAHALLDALNQRDDVEIHVIGARVPGGLATARWIATGARKKTGEDGAAVLHSPAFLAPLNSDVPNVLTIHDLSAIQMPSGQALDWRMYNRFLLPRLARRATTIITPTEVTRQGVIGAFRIPFERVVVTPYGVDERFFELPPRPNPESPTPVIVFPGAPIGRKNLDIVLRVMAAAPPQSALSKSRLEITGATAEDFPRYRQSIVEHGLVERVAWLGRLGFEEVAARYARADVLVYPSFLEGFGFPPLEAMAAGTPVVASNASCLPEVLGEAALLVDPNDDAAFATAVESVLTDPAVRRRLIAAGSAHARMFTWARCAELTAAVYRRAAGGPRARA